MNKIINKNKKTKPVAIALMASIVCVVLITGSVLVFAGESFLSHNQNQVTAGQALKFKVNLSEIKEEYAKASEQFTLTVEISPSPEAVSVSPNVNISQYGSKYTVLSADLNDISALTFSVYPGGNIKTPTAYTVSAKIAGNLSTPSETFTFKALPASKEKKDDKKNKKNNFSGGKGGTIAKGATTGSMTGSGSSSAMTSSNSSAVYQGSSDNYLKKLSVKSHKLTKKFNKTRDTYFVKVSDKVKSLNVSAKANDDDATVLIAGADNVSKNRSKIMVSVTAENGDVRIYRIYVIHTTED